MNKVLQKQITILDNIKIKLLQSQKYQATEKIEAIKDKRTELQNKVDSFLDQYKNKVLKAERGSLPKRPLEIIRDQFEEGNRLLEESRKTENIQKLFDKMNRDYLVSPAPAPAVPPVASSVPEIPRQRKVMSEAESELQRLAVEIREKTKANRQIEAERQIRESTAKSAFDEAYDVAKNAQEICKRNIEDIIKSGEKKDPKGNTNFSDMKKSARVAIKQFPIELEKMHRVSQEQINKLSELIIDLPKYYARRIDDLIRDKDFIQRHAYTWLSCFDGYDIYKEGIARTNK
jgi:hypothetical protein